MGSLFTKRFYCCLLLFVSCAASAQTSFTASASPNPAGKEDYITLRLTVNNGTDIRQINPPSLNDFTVVSGPNQETEMSNSNGVTKQSISLSYILLPKKPGSFSLGSASASISGKTYKSGPVNITVSNKRSSGHSNNNSSSLMPAPFAGLDPFDRPQEESSFADYVLHKGESIPDKVNKNMRLLLHTDKTSCYVGEPILATYKLYSRLRSESVLSKNPSFNGFSVVDMTGPDPSAAQTRESLEGRDYNVYVVRKAQLYPIQAGQIVLESAALDNRVEFYKDNGGNAYGPGDAITQDVTLNSKPVTITVKPLPEENKPAGFKGAVGNFAIEATLEKSNFTLDETGKLLLTISGRGNMQLLTAPDINWPEGIEAFDIKSTDNTDNKTVPISGSKTFEIPFAAEKPGSYNTPRISFSFFDPAAGAYRTVTAAPISFTVSKGTGKVAVPYQSANKKTESTKSGFFTNPWLLILILAGVLISVIIFLMGREKKRSISAIEEAKEETSTPVESIPQYIVQNPLAQTEDCLAKEECVEFYSILNAEMREFLSQKFGLVKDLMNSKTLSAAMDRAGVDVSTSMQTQDLLRDIEWQLYTPFEHNEALHRIYARAQTIVQQLSMQQS